MCIDDAIKRDGVRMPGHCRQLATVQNTSWSHAQSQLTRMGTTVCRTVSNGN